VKYRNGSLKLLDGVYFGEIVNEKPYFKGKLDFSDGRKYYGQFFDGKMQGIGIMNYPDGSKYEGEFLENFPHGKGKLTSKE
jgi:hypothetical protein